MTPCRALDAIVAEKVMNRTPKHEITDEGDSYYDRCLLCGYNPGQENTMGNEAKWPVCDGYPSYSTKITDAWGVVEKMSGTTKEYWTLERFSSGAVATFHYEGGRDLPWIEGEYKADALEMPEAICRAALKAVGVTE